jgi:methylated-DNA-[protein]-cysteine S-methyltransferase
MEQTNTMIVYWNYFVYKEWKMYMAATSKGLCYVSSPNKTFDELAMWVKTRLPNHCLMENDAELEGYVTQFKEYFQGRRTVFTVPVDLYGTRFQLSVWNALAEIPHGLTNSYSNIADRIHHPKSVRAVGAAIGANPILIAVPCHRVIGKNGTLTGYRGGLDMKTALLQLERGDLVSERGAAYVQ